jgi:hypothetical protein
MSPSELKEVGLKALVAEIRDDLGAIHRLLDRLSELQQKFQGEAEPDVSEMMACAGYLHHLYTAMESIHERIASQIDGTLPSGERSHQELLSRMGIELSGIRRRVLSPDVRAQLARLLRFRHFFRHAYRMDLLWIEVKPLVFDVPAIAMSYETELESFCAYLEEAAKG